MTVLGSWSKLVVNYKGLALYTITLRIVVPNDCPMAQSFPSAIAAVCTVGLHCILFVSTGIGDLATYHCLN